MDSTNNFSSFLVKSYDFFDDDLAKEGMLSFDEMAIRKALGVNVRDMTFDDLVDLGNTEDYLNSENCPIPKKKRKVIKENEEKKFEDKLADHALVFMFSSFTAKFTQPIGFFLCKGATESDVLYSLLITAIIETEEAGARVHAICCDGARKNRGIWKHLGVSAKSNGKGRCWFANPVDETNIKETDFDGQSDEDEVMNSQSVTKVYVLSDVPYLIK